MSSNRTARKRVHRLPKERRVADIMAVAREVFREKGYEDAPLSDIAERANVVEGSIYRYFENKRDLLVKVIEDWYEGMLADYGERLSGITGTRNRLRFLIWQHLKTIHDEPALCDLMFQYIRTGRDYSQTTVFDLNREYTRQTLDIIREGIDAGELRDDVPLRLVRDMIYGCIEHRTWAHLRGEGSFDPDAVADAIVDLVLRSLSVQTAAPAPASGPDLAERIERAVARLEALAGT